MKQLKRSYQEVHSRAEQLRVNLLSQIEELTNQNSIALGVPVESRVKSWSSIAEKVERKDLDVNSVRELDDLVGIRLILLFRSDLNRTVELIRSNLDVVSDEDTSSRLSEREFGYQSLHMVVRMPEDWCRVPTLAPLAGLRAEIQVRTLAQHIWAAASHKLQYKHEGAVPPPVRRTINRVAALLETVDLEFNRVLEERAVYTSNEAASAPTDEAINVDNLALILSEYFPEDNRSSQEAYARLLFDLTELGVPTTASLREILERHRSAALKADQRLVRQYSRGKAPSPHLAERVSRGVYFAHVGLAREALRKQFGDDAVNKTIQKSMN